MKLTDKAIQWLTNAGYTNKDPHATDDNRNGRSFLLGEKDGVRVCVADVIIFSNDRFCEIITSDRNLTKRQREACESGDVAVVSSLCELANVVDEFEAMDYMF